MESFTSAPSSEQRPYMREEEYLWSWCPQDPAGQDDEDTADPSVKPGHRPLLKFKAGEESVVQVESEVYNNCKV